MKRIYILPVLALLSFPIHAEQPEKGYRGFLEWSNDLRRPYGYQLLPSGVFDWGRSTQVHSGLSTSHGYQFNNQFFLGAGVSAELHRSNRTNHWFVPTFIQARTDQKWGIFTPFGDLRIGGYYSDSEYKGFYLSPSVGYRFNWGKKVGLNLGIGWTFTASRHDEYEISFDSDNGYTTLRPTGRRFTLTQNHFSFRIGIDFQ